LSSVPLHPALVHIPLGLALILPVITLAFAWTLWTGRLPTRSWLAVVLLLAALLGAGLVAMNTGQREEKRVEAVVPETAIATHETRAEQFLWVTGISLAVAAVVQVLRRPGTVRAATAATVICTFLVAGAAVRVGHAGGQLVYVHNAAAAYTSAKNATLEGKRDAVKAIDQSPRTDRDDDVR